MDKTVQPINSANAAPDYNVKVSIRNGRLLARIRDAGFKTVSAFCKTYGITYTRVESLINLRISGMRSNQEWRKNVILLAEILNCTPQDIIPPQHWQTPLASRTFELPLTGAQAAELVGAAPLPDNDLVRADLVKQLNAKLHLLPARLERCIRLRYGLTEDGIARTLDEVGQVFGVGKERIRQMEAKALDKLRRKDKTKAKDKELQSYLEDMR